MPPPVALAAKVLAPNHRLLKMSSLQENWFAVMGFASAPWIDADRLKERYLELTKRARGGRHLENFDGVLAKTKNSPETAQPPKDGDQAVINRAWQILKNDADRLAHFLELETGRDVRQKREAPEDLIPLFMQLVPLFQKADQTLRAIREESSPILKAKRHLDASPLLAGLSEASEKISALLLENQNRLRKIDRLWRQLSANSENFAKPPTNRSDLLKELQEICLSFSFLQRWQNQLAEKIFQLTPD